MTTIASFPDETYSDSLHILDVAAGDNVYTRRPKINIINEYAAYAISGTAIFPPAVEKAISAELAEIADHILEKGYANKTSVATLCAIVQDEASVLLIMAESRWVIQRNDIVFVPANADIVMGSGAPHHNSLRYLMTKEERPLILSKMVLLDDMTRGPWVRFKHSRLKATKEIQS